MAEFCSQCSPFENEYDIGLLKIAIFLRCGHSENFICEGCNNSGIYKDENGKIYLAKEIVGEIKLVEVETKELFGVQNN
jgi:hypothetical protein